ncbi:hypothetical protein HDR61_04925 [bacterium]|nr:hypothetical protein [bacterium]
MKKLTENQKAAIVFTTTALGLAVFTYALMLAFMREDKYIVSEKGDKVITYHPVSNPNERHTMTFKRDTADGVPGFWPYINVGDTITGRAHYLNRDSITSVGMNPRWGYHMHAITTLNGKTLNDVRRDAARRDSIVRQMKQKQR